MKTVFEIELAGYPIKVDRLARNKFTVTYGLDVKPNLDYDAAARALGTCIFHALTCEGKLDS